MPDDIIRYFILIIPSIITVIFFIAANIMYLLSYVNNALKFNKNDILPAFGGEDIIFILLFIINSKKS